MIDRDYIAAATLPDTHDGQPESGAGAVPPDRERLVDRLVDWSYILPDGWERALLLDAALALRLPVPQAEDEEVDRMLQRLGAAPKSELLTDCVALLRRLMPASLAAVQTAVLAERAAIKQGLEYRLNERLCEMKPNWDDSITGFNDAQEVISAYFRARSTP